MHPDWPTLLIKSETCCKENNKQMQIHLSEIDLEVIPRDEGALWHVLLHAFNCLFVLQGIHVFVCVYRIVYQ